MSPVARTQAVVGARSRVLDALASLVYACVAFVFAFPLVEAHSLLVIATTAALGAALARYTSGTRLRTVVIAGGALLLAALMWGLRSLLLDSVAWAAWLGPADALRWADGLFLGIAAASLACGLRASALRHRFVSVIEVACVALSFAQLVVAHRHGAINRPFEIADPIIAAGGDPVVAFVVIGALSAAIISLLLVNEHTLWRTLLHLAVAAVLLLFVGATARLPQPDAQGGLGLRGGDKKEEGKRDNKRDKSDERRPDEPEFKNEYPSGPDVPLAVVLLHDDYSPPRGLYYFRQSAFSQFNGRKLVRAMRDDVDQDVADLFPTRPLEVQDVPNQEGDRATVETTVGLLADHNAPLALESPVAFEPVDNPDPDRFRRVYRVTSAALVSDFRALLGRDAESALDAEQRAHYLQLPDDPRYADLAQRIVADIPEPLREDPMAVGIAVTSWLSEQGTYSLRSKHAGAGDPTADFLFGDKTGYCVHFAHAASYLMRAADVPARISTGYVIEEAARQGGSTIMLSGRNSHAWAEVWVDGVGWVVADVFPAQSMDPVPAPPDPDLQRLLGEMLRGTEPLPQDTRFAFQPAMHAAYDLGAFALRALGVLALVVLSFLYLGKLWRRGVPWWSGRRALSRVVYRAELDRLCEARLVRELGESRERFARRVAAEVPSFVTLTRMHVGARYGGAQADRSQLRQAARQVRAELRAKVAWWRRMIGMLTPWTWLTSR